MTTIGDLKRELDAACQAIEALDAELAAGRIDPAEHGRRRAERERDAGRLLVALRRVQRAARERRAEEAPPAPAAPAWLRPRVVAPVAVLLVAVGVGAGVLAARGLGGAGAGRPAAAPAGAPVPPVGAMPDASRAIELEALRQAAGQEDAPIATLLQVAHSALDEGRLDEARRLYGRVLAREPRNVEAITHVGGVLYQEGRVDEALAKIEEALAIDPRYIHAHWDRTHYLFDGKRDYPAAVRAAEAFLQVVPDGPDAENVKKLMAEARQRGGTGTRPK
jgi:tetratricopeptide (TPR) repeat protein